MCTASSYVYPLVLWLAGAFQPSVQRAHCGTGWITRLHAGEAKDWELPPEVKHHFARLDADGRAALAACDWWKELKNDPGWEPDPDYDHRQANKMHFVQGQMSPYYIDARGCARRREEDQGGEP